MIAYKYHSVQFSFILFTIKCIKENYNAALSERVRYKVDKDRLDDPHVKANLLFQVFLSL